MTLLSTIVEIHNYGPSIRVVSFLSPRWELFSSVGDLARLTRGDTVEAKPVAVEFDRADRVSPLCQ